MDRIGPSGTNWTEFDLTELNETKIDLIGPNRNCLIYRENKLSSKNNKFLSYELWKQSYELEKQQIQTAPKLWLQCLPSPI